MEDGNKTLADLPKDLVLNIFGRLNCEELVPLSAICKSFSRYLKSKPFCNSHRNKDNISVTRIILSQLTCEDQKITTKIYFLDLYKMMLFPIHIPYSNDFELFVNFIGSENGLVCIRRAFSGSKHVLTIFNPITRDFIDTEDILNHIPHEHTLHAFGYNKHTESFEVMLLFINPMDEKSIWWSRFMVKNFTWLDAQPAGIDKDFISGETLSLENHYVWASKISGPPYRHVQFLIVFDKRSNVFREMKIPEEIVNVKYKLVLHHGKVGLMFYNIIFDGPYQIELWTCDVQTLNENSWMHVYTLHNFPSFFEPICLLDDFTLLTTGAVPLSVEAKCRKRSDIFMFKVRDQQWVRADNMKDNGFLWYRTSYDFVPSFQNVRM